MRQSSRQRLFLPLLVCLFPVVSECISSRRQSSLSSLPNRPAFASSSRDTRHSSASSLLVQIRGGSTDAEKSALDATKDTTTTATQAPKSLYPMEQLLLLQSRSARLRQALIERRVLQDYSKLDGPTVAQPVDWECGLSTPEYPKSCLYSLDAEHFTKVVAPADGNNNWIGLSALNRLRRTDPTKVEPLWHSQYSIFGSWFRGSSQFSMYAYLPWQGYLLALLLDVPLVLSIVVMAVIGFVLTLTRPVWESMLTLVLTSPFLWKKWPSWARFVHAALPLKLLLGQMGWKGLTSLFGSIRSYVREHLVEMECRIWEEAIPLTILEGKMLEKAKESEGDDSEENLMERLTSEESEDDSDDDEGEETSDEDSDDED